MGRPRAQSRALEGRGKTNRLAAPSAAARVRPARDLDRFDVMSSSHIPAALTLALEWAAVFDKYQDPDEAKRLAGKLLRCHEFLNQMEATAPRHPRDGALLIDIPLDSAWSARVRTRMSETTDSRGLPIMVTEDWQEQPPVRAFWQPREFPVGMSAEARALYPKRPLHVAEIPPFHPANVRDWELLRDYDASRAPAGAPTKSQLTNEELLDLSIAFEAKRPPHTLQPSQWKSVADRLASNVKTQVGVMWAAQAALNLVNVPTPLVDATIARLTEITLRDVHEQTDLPINPRFIDDKLIDGTALILYHSVYTVALDATGEPIDFGGAHVPGGYAILVPERDSDMERRVPPPLTAYFSAERTRGSSFRITKGKVTRDFGTGIGTFLEKEAGTYKTHPIQQGLTSFLSSTPVGWAAGVSAPAAFRGHSTSLADKALALPEFVGNAIPYAVLDLNRRIDRLKLRPLANQVGKQLLEEIIENSIKSAVQWMVLKKLGQSFVPAVKLGMKLYDKLSSAGEHDRTRTLLACVTMYLNGNDEDKVIALKAGGQILAEAAQEAVISLLTSKVSGRLGPQTKVSVTDTTPKAKPTPTPAVDKTPFALGDVKPDANLEGFVANDAKKRKLGSAPTTEQPAPGGGKIDVVDLSDRPENQSVQPGTDSVRPRPKLWDTSTAAPDIRDLVAEEAAKKRAEDTARGNQPELRATPADARQTGPQHQGTENRGEQDRRDEPPSFQEEMHAAPKKKGTGTKPPGPSSAQSPGAQSPGTQSPGTQSPGTQSPGTQSPGTQSPGTNTPQPQTPLTLPTYYPGAKAADVAPRIVQTKDGFELRGGQYELVGGKKPLGNKGTDYEQATRSVMPHVASQALGVRVSVDGSIPGAPELVFKEKIGTNPLRREPDATARLDNPKKVVLIETTKDRDFQGFRGHKRRQVPVTAAIEYKAGTQLEYHFISPRDPGKNARRTLREMKKRYPKMKIVWHIVPVPVPAKPT